MIPSVIPCELIVVYGVDYSMKRSVYQPLFGLTIQCVDLRELLETLLSSASHIESKLLFVLLFEPSFAQKHRLQFLFLDFLPDSRREC